MPLLFKPIAVFLAMIIGSIVARIFIAIGIGVITYEAVDSAIQHVRDAIETGWGGIPSEIMAVASLAGFDEAITIILSAITSAISLKIISGTIKRIGFINSES